MIFKQETVKSWFSGMKSSVNTEVIQPFQNAEQVIWKYNQAIQHNSLTQKGWERLLAQSDDGLKAYLTSIKGTTASMTGYTTSLQGNITGFKKVSTAINQYNILATAGVQKQNEFSSAVAITNGQLGNYLRGLNGSKASLSGYVSSLVGATAKTVALQAATMALNAVVSMGLLAVIQLAIQGFDKLMNSAKRASEAADEAFSESNDKVQQNKEELKSLDELIAKYKELKENEELDVEGRKEVKELQNSIADLVGVQASNLDLVNGKLDDEIKKLDEISAKQAKNAYETATANYNNSKKSAENATGDSSIGFVDGYAYVGKREKEAEKILQDAGYATTFDRNNNMLTSGVNNNIFSTIVQDIYDNEGNILKGAQEKADYLQAMIDVLEQNGQRATDLYAGLIKQRDDYLKYIDDQQNAANSLVNSWITYSQFSNKELSKINVNSVESFENYRQKMIEEIQKDETVGQMMADGILSKEDLETAINDYMATSINFSTWYEQWIKGVQNTSNTDEITVLPDISQTIDNLNTRLKPTMDALKEAYQDIFKSEDGEINFSLDDVDISTFESIKSAIGELDEIEGIEINYDDFDNFVKVLSDTSSTSDEVQAQFDKLSTSIVYSADCTQMTKDNFDLLVKSLYEMGLVNAEEVLTNIRNAQEELKASGIDLKNITEEQAQAFLNEAEASDIAKEYLRMYMVQKQLANQPLNTSADVEALENLCNSLGVTGEMLKWVASLKSALGAVEAGAPIQAFQSQIDSANQKIAELAATGGSFSFDFDSNVTSPSSSKGSSGSSKEDKQSIETFDFIETAIKRIEEAIDKLKTKAENTFIGFEIRTKHYASLLGKVTDEINLQSQAYQAYMARANSVGLSEVYASQVRDGSLNIVDITDDKLKEQIKDYQTWYEKAKECQDKVEELKITQTELTQANLELLITKYEKLAEKVSSANDRIQGKLDLKEAWGFHATSGSYTSMNKNIIKQIDYIKKQDEELKKLLNTVEKGSEAWLEYQARLDDNKKSLQDLTKEMAENAKAAAELSGAKAERKVEKYDKSDEKLDAKIDNSIKYKNQNKYLNTEMNNIDRRQKAYDKAVETDKKGIKSTSKAINKTKSNKENKSILKKIKSLVKQKKVISESLLDKASKLGDNGALYDKCVRYNAYISAYEIDKDIADLYRETSQQDKADIAQRKLDNIQTYYKNRQGENNQKAEQLNARIEMAKESGYVESATLYNQLSSVEKQNNASLRTERDKLQESLAKSLLDGSIKKNSDEWYEMCQQIDDVTNEIDQSDLALKQYQNTLRQMKWDSFDYLQGKISNVTSEMDFMINELSRKDLTSDDIGGLTDEGNGVAYLRASKYETLKNQLADYYAELETLEKTEDQYDTKVIERKEELRQRIQDTTSAVQDEKWAIIDLYTQGYEALSNKIKDLIDEYGELLDAEKEAYDWQNTIADKTKEIASIRKQLSAYANDSSEETKAKIQQLNVSLEEAEKDLKDSQYDKFISDTKDMLSDLQEDMDNNIQSIIDNLDKNFDELMASIGENATSSAETVKSAMTGIDYQPSEDFSTMLSTTLEGSTIKTSVDKMTTSIDNLVEILKKRAEENAKGADTTTASEDVKKEAISEQERKVISAKEKLDKFKETFEPAMEEMLRLKAKRDEAGRIWGGNSLKYNEANIAYENAVRHLEELDKERDDLEKAYGDALAELDKLTKYSVGSKHITKDQLAWTQDGGQELVYRSNDGAILTRLGEGDKVFTNEMSENLWKLAQLHPADFMNGIGNVKLPDVTRNVTGGDVRIEFGDLVLPDVTNSAEFANSVEGVMRNAICKNGKTAKCFTEAVSSMQMGRGIGNARLYK